MKRKSERERERERERESERAVGKEEKACLRLALHH